MILVAEGLTTHGLQRGSGQGERIVLWDRPAEMALRPADLPADLASTARLVHVDDVDPDAAIAAGKAGIAAGVPVTSDIEAARPKTPAILDAVTIPIFAEHVPADLTGERNSRWRSASCGSATPGCWCVTLGARGALMLAGDRYIRQPAFPVDVIDTTGAGDVSAPASSTRSCAATRPRGFSASPAPPPRSAAPAAARSPPSPTSRPSTRCWRRLPASGFRLPAPGFRLPASGFPLPASRFRLSATGSPHAIL